MATLSLQMLSYRDDFLDRLELPGAAVWLLADIAEAKGRLTVPGGLSTVRLGRLATSARVASVVSSNRIEGVEADPRRLDSILALRLAPLDRSEEELVGYARALDLILADPFALPWAPELFSRLHEIVFAGSGDAGQWKRQDNEIVELRPGLPPRIRFRPLSASATPAAMAELCDSYTRALLGAHTHPLVAAAALAFDFLAIHPFRDGNGRVARLVATLALLQQGHEVVRYASLEQLVEEARDEYYRVLEASSVGWHEGSHDLIPWLTFFLSVLRQAYRRLERELATEPPPLRTKTAALLAAIASFPAEFTLAELAASCPTASAELVRKVLQKERREGRVQALGRGPGASWRRVG